MKNFKNYKGFTIIELIVVIAVLGILVLLAAPRFLNYVEEARITNIKHDIKVAEGVITEYLVLNDKLPENWTDTSIGNLNKTASQNRLYEKQGLAKRVEDGEYEDSKPSRFAKDNLFDRDVNVEDFNTSKLEVLDYNFPNGIYEPQDLIEGDIMVKGLETGNYTLQVQMEHSKSAIIKEETIEFDLQKDEVKTLNFDYEVTVADRIGFYDFYLVIKENSENLKAYSVPQSIYIAQNEWEYFYEDDFNEMNREVVGQIGALSPDKVSYKYVLEPSGIDYSNVTFNIEPGNNQTGQKSECKPSYQ